METKSEYTPEQKERVKELCRQGISLRDIQRQTGIPAEPVARWTRDLRRNRVGFRSRTASPAWEKKRKKLVQLVKSGMFVNKAAARVGVAVKTARGWLAEEHQGFVDAVMSGSDIEKPQRHKEEMDMRNVARVAHIPRETLADLADEPMPEKAEEILQDVPSPIPANHPAVSEGPAAVRATLPQIGQTFVSGNKNGDTDRAAVRFVTPMEQLSAAELAVELGRVRLQYRTVLNVASHLLEYVQADLGIKTKEERG